MIITLIKNGEKQSSSTGNSERLTHSAVSNLIQNTVMLLHFSGKRPLYSVLNNGEYQLNIPKNTLPLPDFIMTEPQICSYDSGRAMRETLKAEQVEPVAVQSTVKIQSTQSIPQGAQHLIVIANEDLLKKWSQSLCKESATQRAENSEFCIIKDGEVFFDSKTNQTLYVQDGIMDSMLLHHIYNTPIENLEENLLPYRNKISQILPAQFIFNKLYKKNSR